MRHLLPIQLVALAFALLPLTAEEKPNILVLYSDDAGYADFGFQAVAAEDMKKLTPNIDRIAKEGATFTNAYMSGCVCSPSRAGLMTGRYQGRFGYDNNLPPGTKDGLSLEEDFGAKQLQKLGYKTGLIGKWHLGYPAEFHPNKRGFDWFYGLLQGSRPYFALKSASPHRVIQENGKATEETGYVTDRFGDAACRFIKESKDKPFFLFVSFTAPHGPLQAKPEHLEKLKDIPEGKRQKFAGLVLSLDENVGKILDCLKEQGLDENTLVIFTNDNGGQTQLGANNGPLSGKKGTLLEGGVRVPWAMRYPKVIKPDTTIDDPIIALDLVPTFLELAGGEPAPALDGISLVSRIKEGGESLKERPLFWRQHGEDGERAMRLGKWKLHHDREKKAAPKLYDLSKDIGEQNDLAEKEPEQLAKMLQQLDEWETQLQTPRWGPGSPSKKGKKDKK